MQLYHEIIQYEIYSLKVLKYINSIASTDKYYINFARLNDLNNSLHLLFTFFYLLRADAARTTSI